jgi:hypothetical protein
MGGIGPRVFRLVTPKPFNLRDAKHYDRNVADTSKARQPVRVHEVKKINNVTSLPQNLLRKRSKFVA